MPYLVTLDERYYGGLEYYAGYWDAPDFSPNITYVIAEGISSAAYGALVFDNFDSADVFDMGILVPGTYSVRVTAFNWDIDNNILGFQPNINLYREGVWLETSIAGDIEFEVDSAGSYYIKLDGILNGEYQVYYTLDSLSEPQPPGGGGGPEMVAKIIDTEATPNSITAYYQFPELDFSRIDAEVYLYGQLTETHSFFTSSQSGSVEISRGREGEYFSPGKEYEIVLKPYSYTEGTIAQVSSGVPDLAVNVSGVYLYALTPFDAFADNGWEGSVSRQTSTTLKIVSGPRVGLYKGQFTYDQNNELSGGTLHSYEDIYDGATQYMLFGEIDAAGFSDYQDAVNNDFYQLQSYYLGGDDLIQGSDYSDHLLGFSGDDFIRGGDGQDTIDGGEGIDTVVFNDDFADYEIAYDKALEIVTVTSLVEPGDIDTLSNIEFLQFEDQIFSWSEVLPNSPLVGQVVVAGDAVVGAQLIIQTQGLSDEDGLGTFSYQWLRDGAPISGATSSSYTIQNVDIDTGISVEVSYIDGADHEESITSDSRYPVFGNTVDYTDLIEMYILIPNRAPDAGGLDFWSGILDDGETFEYIAGEMWNSAATQALYPPEMSTEDKVTAIYNNVLNREPDEEGLDFWVGRWEIVGPVDTMLEMIENINNYQGANHDGIIAKQLFMHKVDVGAYLSISQESNDLELGTDAYAYLSGGHSLEETITYIDQQLEVIGQSSAETGDNLFV